MRRWASDRFVIRSFISPMSWLIRILSRISDATVRSRVVTRASRSEAIAGSFRWMNAIYGERVLARYVISLDYGPARRNGNIAICNIANEVFSVMINPAE